MRVAHIIFSFETGGTECMLVDILNAQVANADVTLFIINNKADSNLLAQIDEKVHIVCLNRKEGSKNIMPLIRFNLKLMKWAPDVLHFHNQNGISLLLLDKWKKKSILTVHTTHVTSKFFKSYRKIVSISDAVSDDLLTREAIKSQTIYNGVDSRRIKKRQKITSEPLRIVQVSRLQHDVKGQHLLLRAISLLKEYRITVDFIGEGKSKQHLSDLTDELGLGTVVNFLGLKDRDYIYSHLAEYDLLVQPSLNEGFGLTVVEALSAKLPVIVSNIEGPMEIIQNGKFGFFFESGNVQHLANEIRKIINFNNEMIGQSVERSYKHVQENFEISFTVKNYFEVYKGLKS